MVRAAVTAFIGMTLLHRGAGAQDMPGMPGMQPTQSTMQGPLGISMTRMGSGTTWIPDAVSLPSSHKNIGGWDFMLHGLAFLQYDRQGGPRGDDQFGSLNWAMLMASRNVAGGRFEARTMLSLDPATVTRRGYPLLLQSGETYNGEPLHDYQHPHDFWMELAALYEREISPTVAFSLYLAPSGEPALSGVAFMHRPSAFDDPVAPLGHHWMDATHISFGVITAGLFTRSMKLEGSVFNGRAPDESRWNFDRIKLDSWSGRLTVNPDSQWSISVGYGFLKSPEALEPDESTYRATLGVLNGRKIGADGQWSSALVVGSNRHGGEGRWTVAALVESEAVLDDRNTVFGRAELVQKSTGDLVLPTTGPDAVAAGEVFDVGALSLGYIRELGRGLGATLGVGVRGTMNFVPAELGPFYGSRVPLGALVFMRVRAFHKDPMAGMVHE
jgi:hypothetical protein